MHKSHGLCLQLFTVPMTRAKSAQVVIQKTTKHSNQLLSASVTHTCAITKPLLRVKVSMSTCESKTCHLVTVCRLTIFFSIAQTDLLLARCFVTESDPFSLGAVSTVLHMSKNLERHGKKKQLSWRSSTLIERLSRSEHSSFEGEKTKKNSCFA